MEFIGKKNKRTNITHVQNKKKKFLLFLYVLSLFITIVFEGFTWLGCLMMTIFSVIYGITYSDVVGFEKNKNKIEL